MFLLCINKSDDDDDDDVDDDEGGGGVQTPWTLPLDPPLKIVL